jgi:hypothetical protein
MTKKGTLTEVAAPERLVALDGSRIHPSWASAGDLALAIMRGEHDAEITSIGNAVSARNKARFRKGAKFILTGTKNVSIDGKVATVIKVNPKRISVGIGEPKTEYGSTYYPEGEYNVPPTMLAPIDVASTS